MTLNVNVYGIVQGVGFRPFAKRIAGELDLAGYVQNCNGIVAINITGDKEALDEYVRRLTLSAPPEALITKIETTEVENNDKVTYGQRDFVIINSQSDGRLFADNIPVIAADIATCDNCLQEMYDKNNRRYMHPFISCTGCGPRYSIIKEIPYDRDTTVMGDFVMCDKCGREYSEIDDVRCHAQTIACKDCGPRLELNIYDAQFNDADNSEYSSNDIFMLSKTAGIINAGGIAAVKDIGGYHFVCRTDNITALRKMRELKRRQNKAFAVMFSNVRQIREYALVNEAEAGQLISRARPIVLVRKRENRDFYPEVCGDSGYIGAMLPCNPIQTYLVNECGPLVMTSGNLGGEPIITDDEEMKRLVLCKGIVSAVLSHNRPILTPLDDSIVRVYDNRCQLVRRARGLVPLPIYINKSCSETVLASGGDLKGAFCFISGGQAVMSQHFGDLDDMDACGAWKRNIKRLGELHGMKPAVLVCDIHPRYYSSQISKMLYDYNEVIQVQHHHAHIASVIAEHGLTGKVLGIAFDGTGMGTDGTIWGSEVLMCEGAGYERLAHLKTVTMIGADEAAKDAELALMCYLKAADIRPSDIYGELDDDKKKKYAIIDAAVNYSVGAAESSSMGRLFDAVCALTGIKNCNSYEGECAMALEKAADWWFENRIRRDACNGEDKDSRLPDIRLEYYNGVWDTVGLIRQIADIIISNKCDSFEFRACIAYAFHKAVADAVVEYVTIHYYREHEDACAGIDVALSGGVFMNRIIMSHITDSLKKSGHKVYYNEQVPMNDGGIALGQGYIAACMLS